MSTQHLQTLSSSRSWREPLIEILTVFLPVIVLFELASNWVGEDPIRGFIMVWIAYAIMIGTIWVTTKFRSKTWRELGLVVDSITFKGSLKLIGWSLVVFVVAVAAYLMAPAVASLLIDLPGSPDFARYDYLEGHIWKLLISLVGVYIISSFGEELIFRAFMIDRIVEMFGGGKFANVVAVILSSVLFGMIHYEWGLLGMIQTGFMGLAMGCFYVFLKRRIWILVLAHVYMDTVLMVQLYLASNA